VKINGLRVKPAATVKVGDVVEFLKGDVYRRVIISALPEAQASKEVGRTMYVDETPVQERQPVAASGFRDRGSGRPTKRERRELEKRGLGR
jgi:ribosome-associated heat shock protein Hsp15